MLSPLDAAPPPARRLHTAQAVRAASLAAPASWTRKDSHPRGDPQGDGRQGFQKGGSPGWGRPRSAPRKLLRRSLIKPAAQVIETLPSRLSSSRLPSKSLPKPIRDQRQTAPGYPGPNRLFLLGPLKRSKPRKQIPVTGVLLHPPRSTPGVHEEQAGAPLATTEAISGSNWSPLMSLTKAAPAAIASRAHDAFSRCPRRGEPILRNAGPRQPARSAPVPDPPKRPRNQGEYSPRRHR
jgi:hypothetical protein